MNNLVDEYMKNANIINEYIDYISNINTQNTKKERLILKKERFVLLLRELFPNNADSEVITAFALGAEKSITNIKRSYGADRRQADTQYHSIIIKFEKNLLKTGDHAKYQLCEYLTTNWNSDIKLEFTLIASDYLKWIIYAPNYESLTKLSDFQYLSPLDVKLELLELIVLEKTTDLTKSKEQAGKFFYFLDLYLFRQKQKLATLDNIRKYFGKSSSVYRAAINNLYVLYHKIRKDKETKLRKLEKCIPIRSLLYRKRNEPSEQIFLTHTYLSILAKILAFIAIENKISYNNKIILSILNGDIFKKYNVENFSDYDYYYWVADIKYFNNFKPTIYIILKALSLFKFTSINNDILKGVYQELIDDDTRHCLGEFFTPDWLCTKIVKKLDIKIGYKILDPACRSGSFLKAVANELCEQKTDISAKELSESLYGIDIHPLSVQISKSTILMILGARLLKEKSPLTIHIYLSNTLSLPDDRLKDDTVDNYFSYNIFNKNDPVMLNNSYELYNSLYNGKFSLPHSFREFIEPTLYPPYFFQAKFDVVVGNPLWLTFADIGINNYQKNIQNLAEKYNMLPKSNNMTHLEIGAVFLAHSINYFLNKHGKTAMVLPRSFFSGSQHELTRQSLTANVEIDELWDLREIKNLFKVPICVVFAKQKNKS
jgi:hypothetical protein